MEGWSWSKFADEILLIVNLMSAAALLFFVFAYFIKFHDGSMMTWIAIQGYGNGFSINYGMDVTAPIALITIFLVTQIYLNLRRITKRD